MSERDLIPVRDAIFSSNQTNSIGQSLTHNKQLSPSHLVDGCVSVKAVLKIAFTNKNDTTFNSTYNSEDHIRSSKGMFKNDVTQG